MRHKRTIPNRSFRVADQIQRDVALLIRELKDPRVGMVTINAVEVTPDYAHAKIFFSVLVSTPRPTGTSSAPRGGMSEVAKPHSLISDPAQSEIALNEAAGFLRNGLFKRLQIHTVPTLHFQYDRTTERAAELSALINRANAERAKE